MTNINIKQKTDNTIKILAKLKCELKYDSVFDSFFFFAVFLLIK